VLDPHCDVDFLPVVKKKKRSGAVTSPARLVETRIVFFI
jgi:hypothetical protein